MDVTIENVLLSFFYGGDIVTYGWYLLVIMIFYQIFYVGAKWCKSHICLAVSALTLIYIGIAIMLDMSSWWYMSCLAFPGGIIFAQYKHKFDYAFCHCRFVFIPVVIVLYLCCFAFSYMAGDDASFLHRIPYFAMLRRCFTAFHGVTFCFLTVGALMLIGKSIRTDFMITRRLSSIYLEIYVMQGFALYMVRNAWGISNEYTMAAAMFVLTLLLAITIHPVFKKIISLVKIPQGNTVKQ